MQKRIRIAAFILAAILIFSPSGTSFAAEHRDLSDEEIGAISQNCSSIKIRLQRVQKDDAKNRVYLGSQYETIASKLMLNLNLRLVKNGMANALLAEQQTTFMSERDRFKNDPFIIRDVRRNKAMISYQKHWYISTFDDSMVPALSGEETEYRRLWKTFFDNIAIKERKNSRCQRQFMPQRYWKHLTEMTQQI